MDIEKKIIKILNEDLVAHGTYNPGAGYDWHNRQNPIQLNLIDILKMDRSDWEKAATALPHQLQPVFSRVVDAIDSVDGIKDDFKRAYDNPLIKGHDDKKELIKKSVAKLNGIKKAYTEIVQLLDSLNQKI